MEKGFLPVLFLASSAAPGPERQDDFLNFVSFFPPPFSFLLPSVSSASLPQNESLDLGCQQVIHMLVTQCAPSGAITGTIGSITPGMVTSLLF